MLPLIRLVVALCRPGGPEGGPPREGALARTLRQRRDRARLAALDERLLRDMGLRREISAAGLDFVPLSPADPGAAARPASSPQDCRRRGERGFPAAASHRHGAIDRP